VLVLSAIAIACDAPGADVDRAPGAGGFAPSAAPLADGGAPAASAVEAEGGAAGPAGAGACRSHADCATGCGDDGRCASAPSCTRTHGGRTCGADGKDDCCAVAQQGTARVDRYLVTAGRMRAFVERVSGDVRGFVDGLPSGRWDKAWTDPAALPTDVASADAILGGAGNKKACEQGAYTGHTYWTPRTEADFSDFDRDTLDDKALNCVPWALLQALCVWDGGHLATRAELEAAFTNGGTTRYPWGDDALESVRRPDPKERLNIESAFRTAPLPAKFRADDNGEPLEVSYRIAPPGRFPRGNNRAGIADAAGNLLEWVGDGERQFVWKGDFEHHADNAETLSGSMWWATRKGIPIGVGVGAWVWGERQLYGNAGGPEERNGYYAIGGRCAR